MYTYKVIMYTYKEMPDHSIKNMIYYRLVAFDKHGDLVKDVVNIVSGPNYGVEAITKAHTYGRSFADKNAAIRACHKVNLKMRERERVKNLWEKALNNMPGTTIFPEWKFNLGKYGQQTQLTRLLCYRNHNGVYNALKNGSIPKGDRYRKLRLLAGPYGKQLAYLKLKGRTVGARKVKQPT